VSTTIFLNLYGVFETREIEEREIGEREQTHHVWNKRDTRENDQRQMGPT